MLCLLPDLDASNRTRNHSEGWIPEAAGNQTLEVVGCRDPPQTWCSHVGRIYLFQYGIAMILLAVGYPAANLITYAIFSKILGPFPQVRERGEREREREGGREREREREVGEREREGEGRRERERGGGREGGREREGEGLVLSSSLSTMSLQYHNVISFPRWHYAGHHDGIPDSCR